MKRNCLLLLPVIVVAFAFCLSLAAQSDAVSGQPIVGAEWKKNAEELKHYSYKRRTEAKVNGQSAGVRLELVRYVDGKVETVPLQQDLGGQGPSKPDQKSDQKPGLDGGIGHGALLKRIGQSAAARKKEEESQKVKATIDQLKTLLEKYASPDPDLLRTAMQKAAISTAGSGPEPAIKLTAKGVLDPSDSVAMTWLPSKRRPEKIEITAPIQGKPVTVVMDYASLPDGVFYVARTSVNDPSMKIAITIDNFDYTRTDSQ